MNFESIKKGLKNKDQEIIIQIQNTLIQKDIEDLKKLYNYLKTKANKQVLYDFIILLITSVDYIYDNKMNLNKDIAFLFQEQKYILKYLFNTGKKLTKKEISLLDDERLSFLPLEDSKEEIIKRIEHNIFAYSNLGSKKLTELFNELYSKKEVKILDIMIDNYNFIMEYNNSNIDTSNLLDITSNIEFREKIITSTKFNKDLFTSPSLITPYLSTKEVNYLKTDVKINNLLLENGLRFDTLDKYAINNILDNLGLFKLYPYTTIYEFAESYIDKEELSDNDIFLDIYLNKIDEIKMPNTFLNQLTKDKIVSILKNKLSEIALITIYLSTTNTIKKELLSDTKIKDIIYKTSNKNIYKYLDDKMTLEILNNKDHLLRDYYDVLTSLPKRVLLELDYSKIYEEYLELNKKHKITQDQKEFLISTFDFNIEKPKQPTVKLKKEEKERKIINSEDVEKTYKNLKEKNSYLDDTLNKDFLDYKTIRIKFSILEYITKNKEIQDYLKVIATILEPNDINNLFKAFEGLDKEYFLPPILKIISASIKGKNRKKVGDFAKFFQELKNITPKHWNSIIDYLLYFVPLVPGVIKNHFLTIPKTIKEILDYEHNLQNIDDEFFKHYKLTKEERYYLINKYSKKNNIINEIYNDKEQELVNRKIYTLKEIYTLICDIRKNTTNTYNISLTNSMNNLLKIDNRILKTNFVTYISKSDYTYLLLNANNISTYSSYIKYLNTISTKIELNIMTNNNIFIDGLYYGYTELQKEDMISENNEFLLLNKMTTNSPNPYRLPNIILIIEKDNDISLLDQALKIYEEFSKKIKIVILNKHEQFINLINKYNKTQNIKILKEALKYYDSSYHKELNNIKNKEKIIDILRKFNISL